MEPTDGQHWKTVRELCMQKDKEQCESWKDEVQNILIFSGLFSAIVTAFLIESQKELRPPDQGIQLLRQIAAQSAGKNWVAEVEPELNSLSICVNIFWFLSLVLSLTTALVGIVSLQWIRSHMQTLGKGADSLGLSYMHSQGLHQSYIPLVFTSLPVILILGLTFFLIGLIIFLSKLSWPVAIPLTFAVACTFTFLLITTLLPALQPPPPLLPPSDGQIQFPSPYRSPQSSLFLRRTDWGSRSKIWLQHRTNDLVGERSPLGQLESIREDTEPKTFAYDTIEALRSVQQSRSAESDKEKTALAKCLAEVLPIHLNLFPTGDLADLIPFLPPSEYVPSAVFLHEVSATREDLSAVALLKVATCKGRPLPSADLDRACIRATRWLLEQPRILDSVPNKQPLRLISRPDNLSPDDLEVLIDALSHFFSFATDFQPMSQTIGKTTHTSPYTYEFLALSAKILTASERLLSEELQARHAFTLRMIAVHLGRLNANDYLFHTASIYASNVSTSQTVRSSPWWGDFLRAVNGRRGDFLRDDSSQLCKALKADEVVWANIDRALEALRPSDVAFGSDSHGAIDTIGADRPLARRTRGQNPMSGERGESGGRLGGGDAVIFMGATGT